MEKKKKIIYGIITAICLAVIAVAILMPRKGKNPLFGEYNGHEWVDLGLPSGTKWATCNLGAQRPEGYGKYYAFGEVKNKEEYTYENYTQNELALNGSSIQTQEDAATQNWGEPWRMPTAIEIDELLANCKLEWVDRETVHGLLLTSKINGNSIFLPASGWVIEKELREKNSCGHYMSTDAVGLHGFAGGMNFYDYECHAFEGTNFWVGKSIRPVAN